MLRERFSSLKNIGALRPSSWKTKRTRPPQELTGNSASSRDMRGHRQSIEKKSGGAVSISAVRDHMRILQTLQHFGAGMMVNISRTHRYHGEPWPHGSK